MATPEAPVAVAAIEGAPKDIADITSAVKHPTAAGVEEAIADVTTLAAESGPILNETKAGYKTTEFYAAIAAAILDVSTSLPQTDKVAILALAGLYAIARGIAKNGVPFVKQAK